MSVQEQESKGDLRTCLTVAGFDPSGGAGVIADIRTFSALGCHSAAAVTSLTMQNAKGFYGAVHTRPEVLRGQLEAVFADGAIASVKIGMLPTAPLVGELARFLEKTGIADIVVDPVLASSTGAALVEKGTVETALEMLYPLARLLTPNVPEAEKLAGMRIRSESDAEDAAAILREKGIPNVLLKGGHLDLASKEASPEGSGNEAERRVARDILFDGTERSIFDSAFVEGARVRGTGCMLSSAIAAGWANGLETAEAAAAAKRYVTSVIRAESC